MMFMAITGKFAPIQNVKKCEEWSHGDKSMDMTKEIKCVRCRRLKVVPSNWKFAECQTCHERTIKRFRRTSITDIEKKAISQLLNFESAYRSYKQLARRYGRIPKPKEEFRTEWLKHQELRIEGIKRTIAKYDDKRCPIMSYECLEWRRLFTVRCSYTDFEKFGNDLNEKEWNFFHGHVPKCESCNQYYVLHQNDVVLPESTFKEEGVSQEEFDKSLDDFFGVMKGTGDPVDDAIAKMGFKPCCGTCGTVLIDGRCPKGCSDISLTSNINREYDRRPQQQPEQPHDPLREELQREYDIGKSEVERINKLSDRKLKKWLEEPEDE
jgi:hypothetical protein